MSKLTEKELRTYFSQVSKAVVCGSKQKKDFLKQLKSDVEAFLSENPDITIKEIENCFGTPEKIATSFIDNTNSARLKDKLSLKKLIIVAVAIALLGYIAFVVISLIDVHSEAHGYFEEGIMMINNQSMGGGLL